VNAQPIGVLVPLFSDDNTEGAKPILVHLPVALRDKLSQIARRETEIRKQRGVRGVISRRDVILRFLELGCEQYESTEGLGIPDGTKRSRRK
jgi:hypothetical protein